MFTLPRRQIVLAAAAIGVTRPARAASPELEPWKMRACGCCTAWVGRSEAAGFPAKVHEVDDLGPVRAGAGVPAGSPGMEIAGEPGEAFDVIAFAADGGRCVYLPARP